MKWNAYGGEGIAGVGDEHARLSDGAVADGDAFDESRGGHGFVIEIGGVFVRGKIEEDEKEMASGRRV